MIKGFKEFIARGNVIDLAVAVVIGAAFTTIVNAIVKGIIDPLLAMIFDAKSLDHVQLGPFLIGSVLGAVINFLAVAVIVYFVFVFPMNLWRQRQAAKEAAGKPEEPNALTEQEILLQIRDILERQQKQSAGPTQ
jgi:large conductance mechanosensitive channel